jgi:hypothetical protein
MNHTKRLTGFDSFDADDFDRMTILRERARRSQCAKLGALYITRWKVMYRYEDLHVMPDCSTATS